MTKYELIIECYKLYPSNAVFWIGQYDGAAILMGTVTLAGKMYSIREDIGSSLGTHEGGMLGRYEKPNPFVDRPKQECDNQQGTKLKLRGMILEGTMRVPDAEQNAEGNKRREIETGIIELYWGRE